MLPDDLTPEQFSRKPAVLKALTNPRSPSSVLNYMCGCDINNANDIDKSSLIKVNEDQFIEEFLPQIVCSNSNCEVVDKSGNVKGYISNKELQSSLTKS